MRVRKPPGRPVVTRCTTTANPPAPRYPRQAHRHLAGHDPRHEYVERRCHNHRSNVPRVKRMLTHFRESHGIQFA